MFNLEILIGRRLTFVRFYGNMLGLHFGLPRPHSRGGQVAEYALHVDCPWRIDGADRTITGNYDRWDYAGPGEEPEEWNSDLGSSVRDKKLDELFGQKDPIIGWTNAGENFVVVSVNKTKFGDLVLELSGQYRILVFPAASDAESWRLFKPGGRTHLVFPPVADD